MKMRVRFGFICNLMALKQDEPTSAPLCPTQTSFGTYSALIPTFE